MEIDTETGQDDMGGVIEKLDHQGNLTAEPRATGGRRWGKAFKAKLEGFREVVNTPQGPEVTETYTMKYGFWRMVKKGLTLGLADGGGKAVTIEHTQDAFGTRVKMTTPKETITRSTEILDGRTVSNGTFRRKGFWSTKNEKDTVEIDSQKGVHTVEKQRNEDGTTSRAITTTQFVDGARAVERETSGKYKIRASSPRQGGGKNWMRSRQGKYFKWQYGRHNGNFHARFDTPWFNLGKTVFVYNEKTGEVSNVPADELAEDYEVEDGDEGDYATR
jgi:hypothetical protein